MWPIPYIYLAKAFPYHTHIRQCNPFVTKNNKHPPFNDLRLYSRTPHFVRQIFYAPTKKQLLFIRNCVKLFPVVELPHGEVVEWSKAHAWKACVR